MMGMLRWKCGKTRKDRIINERVQELLGVASIGDQIRETHLRWFGPVQRKPSMVPVSKSYSMQVDSPPRERGRPKTTWMEVLIIDLKNCSLSKDLTRY